MKGLAEGAHDPRLIPPPRSKPCSLKTLRAHLQARKGKSGRKQNRSHALSFLDGVTGQQRVPAGCLRAMPVYPLNSHGWEEADSGSWGPQGKKGFRAGSKGLFPAGGGWVWWSRW